MIPLYHIFIPPWSIIKSNIFVIFTSYLCCNSFITFLPGIELHFQLIDSQKRIENKHSALDARSRIDPTKIVCYLSLCPYNFSVCKGDVIFRNKSASFNIQFKQHSLAYN